ncbi:hypothetical protein EO087_12620 [Dyella sp. M7H15-1]|uniref:hypothetical protein n=1 Tax=Dyella sp. M7H15-1 TaxID=2501295 RepID=UPI001004EB76|nr:hypothetical protein [Dyella sp. M7H15-1]QAU24727.1 hypothetical protein EO087_12620 [Dyella sp. M7H15-1]
MKKLTLLLSLLSLFSSLSASAATTYLVCQATSGDWQWSSNSHIPNEWINEDLVGPYSGSTWLNGFWKQTTAGDWYFTMAGQFGSLDRAKQFCGDLSRECTADWGKNSPFVRTASSPDDNFSDINVNYLGKNNNNINATCDQVLYGN